MSGVALVTGGARGIGWAVGKPCATRAGRWWRRPRPGRDGGRGTGIAYREMDVCDREQVSSTLAAVVDEYGSLDLLVNNAGITRHRPLVDLTWEDWSAVVDVNLNGVFNCLQAAGRIMIERGSGVIVNMASVAAERGAAGRAPYATTKAAIVGLTRSAAVEWAPHGVRVNAVGPGYVDDGRAHRGYRRRDARPGRRSWNGSPRAGSPTPTRSARWSASSHPRGAYVNGQVFYVDGGFLADYGVNVRRRP